MLTLTQTHFADTGLLAFATALGPTIVALLVLVLGIIQFLSSRAQTTRQQGLLRQQVRLDLFDRRQEIYRRFRSVQSELVARMDCSRETAVEATAVQLDAAFLFPNDVIEFLERFQKLAWDLHFWESLHESALRHEPGRVQSEIERRTQLSTAVGSSYDEADRLFRSAMAIDI